MNTITEQELLQRIRGLVEDAGTQRAAAKMLGVTDAYLHDVLKGRRQPAERLAAYFGYVPVRVYAPESEKK